MKHGDLLGNVSPGAAGFNLDGNNALLKSSALHGEKSTSAAKI
jgi:hypothetical protein